MKNLLTLALCVWMFVGCTQNSTNKDMEGALSTAQTTEPVDTGFVRYWAATLYPDINTMDTLCLKVTKAERGDISKDVYLYEAQNLRDEIEKVKNGGSSPHGAMSELTVKYLDALKRYEQGPEMNGVFYEAYIPHKFVFQLYVDSTKCLRASRKYDVNINWK